MSEFFDWLLAAETPSLRYLTRRNLMEQSANDALVKADQQAIMQTGPVPLMLAQQTPAGHWDGEHSYYTPKYRSTHWSLYLLTEFAVDPADVRFQNGVDYMLTATAENMQQKIADDVRGLACFWGNLLRYAVYAGKADDERTQLIVDYAVRDLTDEHCRCSINSGLACAWGVVRTLYGLAALPAGQRSPAVQDAIAHALPFLLESFQLIEANYPVPTGGKIHPLWFKLNFPLFYQVDILFTLRILAELGALDHPGAQPALEWLHDKRQQNGRWRGRSPYRQTTYRELGGSTETDRWVSLQAALILHDAAGK